MSFSYNLAQFIAFRDLAECERVRAIRKQDITKHANPDFQIQVIEDLGEFYAAFATDIVSRIRQALEEGRQFTGIFPVGPMPQYAIAARMINATETGVRDGIETLLAPVIGMRPPADI